MRAMFNLLLGASAPKSLIAREDEPGGSGEGDGFEEVASFHGAVWPREKRRQAAAWIQYLLHEGILLRSSPRVVASPCPPSNRVAAGRPITRRIDATICPGPSPGDPSGRSSRQ